ncbi:nuclear transport factor 2 family protein [Nocardia sp. NPDC046473]|uniref:nuclear transport factor 2 family protein n=1 Tax=Nocardia sp. NPDC046473 TaxID=3155733 RepID=UPI0033EC78BD
MIPTDQLTDPAVRAFVTAVNSNDPSAFRGTLTPDATMSDDGSDEDLDQWAEKEIFSANGHMEIESEADDGHSLIANFHNDTWGDMRTKWRFTVDGGQVARFDTGQA